MRDSKGQVRCENKRELHIPEGKEYICPWYDVQVDLVGYPPDAELSEEQRQIIEKIYLPKTVNQIECDIASLFPGLKGFSIDERNPYFKEVDGVLYNKKMTKLIFCPPAYQSSVFTVPETVIKIAPNAFTDCRFIKKIMISDTVKVIGDNAFAFSTIEEVHLPKGLQNITRRMFYCCEKLQSIYLPQSIKAIRHGAFSGCIGLKELHLPENLEIIEGCAFAHCDKIQKLYLPETLKYIDLDSFNDMYGLTEVISAKDRGSFRIKDGLLYNKDFTELLFAFPYADKETLIVPDSVKIIKDKAFSNLLNLKYIYIPKQVQQICADVFCCAEQLTIYCEEGSYAHIYAEKNDISVRFRFPEHNDCKNAVIVRDGVFKVQGSALIRYLGHESVVTVPEYIHKICSYAFLDHGITKIVIPDTIKIIESNAFYNCEHLEEIILPTTIQSMSEFAFSNCNRIKKLILPEGTTRYNFYGCGGLEYLYLPSTFSQAINEKPLSEDYDEENDLIQIEVSPKNKRYCTENGFLFNSDKTRLIAYLGTDETVKVPKGVKVIGKKAFFHKNIREICLPEGITTIKSAAFAYCTHLKRINLPDSIKTIENDAFGVCRLLQDMSLPKSLLSISSYAFAGCRFESVVIPNGVTKIKSAAFAACLNLDTIYIPGSVTEIAHDAFRDNDSILFICPEKSYAREFAKLKGIECRTE